MEAIKKITHVKNNTLIIPGLNTMNNKTVEVIIFPVDEGGKDKKMVTEFPLRGRVRKYDNPFEPIVSPEDWEAMS